MNETRPARQLGRSLLALFAGFVVVVALTILTDFILHKVGLNPALGQPMSSSLFLLATLYRTLYGVAGSYVTARLAPHHPMGHALLGGAIGLILSVIGAVTTWNRPDTMGAEWYPLALVVLAMPQSWLGGKIRTMQIEEQPLTY